MADTQVDSNEVLLSNVKKQVKQIMEESVTRKFVHEESCILSSLCGSVECCLLDGIRKRALGLFSHGTTTFSLLRKLAKLNLQPAQHVVKIVGDIETKLNKKNTDGSSPRWTCSNSVNLWIRVALLEKVLVAIVEYLVDNCAKFYEQESFISNPVCGPILASLLVGPCALDYTKIKTPDHYWTDPPAGELLQRHRIHNTGSSRVYKAANRQGLQVKVKSQTSSSSEDSARLGPSTAKDYVESLHQNYKTTLIYGKNNVLLQPKEDMQPLPGYLSLHQGFDGLVLKWTPNQLMNTSADSIDSESDRSHFWNFAITVHLDEIVYLHCHQKYDANLETSAVGGTVILVGQDGVQRSPIVFPRGGHLLAFLTCLETGLLPNGQLDPPLWSEKGKGKVFPRLKRKVSSIQQDMESFNSSMGSTDYNELDMDDTTSDYVFRIVSTYRSHELNDELQLNVTQPQTMSKSSSARHITGFTWPTTNDHDNNILHENYVKDLCDTMSKQIRRRAFYGWLSHCRHLKTVRTHLSGLVGEEAPNATSPSDAGEGITPETWAQLRKAACESPDLKNTEEMWRLVYYGGVDASLRATVWPFLLQLYPLNFDEAEIRRLDAEHRSTYENLMSQWSSVEAIVRQQDKETMAQNLAKMVNNEPIAHPHLSLSRKDSTLSNDVFESMDSDDDFHPPETLMEESTPTSETDNPIKGRLSIPSNDEGLGSSVGNSSITSENNFSTNGTVNATIQPTIQSLHGGTYSREIVDAMSLNLHRIDKDVDRCDRNYPFFMKTKNLDKLRNVMCTYVWENIESGYVQGMCDLVAPLLVTFQDEAKTYSCFCKLMKRMNSNFPQGGAMDRHFANMRSLIQILDTELFEHMQQNGDYTHFYFCYRWFLLDFKREMVYDDVFRVWETIWSANRIATSNFVLFVALALVEFYREIIIDNGMDFTDIIKFFNEMAEKHNVKQILTISRDLVDRLHDLIANK